MSDYRKILEQVRDGEVSVEEALLAIKKSRSRISATPRWIITGAFVRERRR